MSPPSTLAAMFAELGASGASWRVEIGAPAGPGWLHGADLRDASRGPFHALLTRIGERLDTTDRRTVAASFSLRLGWASAMAIAPWLRYRCVPDVSLDNVSFKFRDTTFLERTALHAARATVVRGDPRATAAGLSVVDDEPALLRVLRATLAAQAEPVVQALHAWSGFAPKGTWGQLTSSWASHLTGLWEDPLDQRGVLPALETLFDGDDIVAATRPRMHAVTVRGVTHLFQRRASCCRVYLLPRQSLCASCPLVPHPERLARNRAWMETQLTREGRGPGHG